MTGFLNNPFLIEIAQLDIVETEKDPDGAGLLTSGYDNDFKETIPYDQPNNDGSVVTRTTTRKENTICVPAQVRTRLFERLQQLRSGNSPDGAIELTFHRNALESLDVGIRTRERTTHLGTRDLEDSDQCVELSQEALAVLGRVQMGF